MRRISRRALRKNCRGVTLVEMTLCLLIAMALIQMALPVAETGARRERELEARQTLREIRRALDRWHDQVLAGERHDAPWPPALAALVEARLLRRVPEDPLTGAADWRVIPAADPHQVWDVRTRAAGRTLDEVDYADL